MKSIYRLQFVLPFLMLIAAPVWAVPGPVINSITGDHAVGQTQDDTFTVSATGALLTYQWKHNGTNLTDDTHFIGSQTTNLTIHTALAGDAGSYSVLVANSSGNATGGPSVLHVVVPPIVTAITNRIVNGTNVVFTAVVAPDEANYQAAYYWNKEGVDIVTNSAHLQGVNTTNLTIINASSADTGSYQIAVFNLAGVATNNPDLGAGAVFAAPSIGSSTGDQSAALGAAVNFNVNVTGGTGPLTYQWRQNFANLTNGSGVSGADTASLTITAIGAANYDVVVKNAGGQAVSTAAHLSIVSGPTAPTLGLQFASGVPQLMLYGQTSSNFVIFCTTNLSGTNWTTLTTVTNLSSSPYQFLDTNAVGLKARFYRAAMQ